MGFFKKLWNVHDKVFHPIETSLKKKGGSNTFGGLLKGAGISPKDAPVTVPGSSFQQRPGYNAQTHMFEPTGPTPGAPITNPNNGGRTYTQNPFAAQQAQAQAIRQPNMATQLGQMPQGQPPPPQMGIQKPMGAFAMGPGPNMQPQPMAQSQKDQGSYAQPIPQPYEPYRAMMF